ncbi:MAG: hypothetical protein LBG97_01985 [Coriobacteriales bacterium]|jgi:hypothetical protein|nr:hypothetical protein [Coriobacteriales bacterium]
MSLLVDLIVTFFMDGVANAASSLKVPKALRVLIVVLVVLPIPIALILFAISTFAIDFVLSLICLVIALGILLLGVYACIKIIKSTPEKSAIRKSRLENSYRSKCKNRQEKAYKARRKRK